MESVGKRMPTRGSAGLLLAILLGTAFSFALRETADIGQLVLQPEPVERARARDGSPRLVGRSSTVTVVLFTDYRCPACRSSDKEIVDAVIEDGHVDLVVRPLTLFGHESQRAARVALAADKQGRFLAMHRTLMSASQIDDAGVVLAALEAGVNFERLKADLAQNSVSIDSTIARNRLAAFGLGLNGTPSYLIGRYRVMGALSQRQIRRLLRQARADGAAI